ncbi:Na+/H+ antiporter subunit E [Monashia sp. NPDC004114]
MQETVSRFVALAVWAGLVWLVLTWSLDPEQLVAGGLLALGTALAMTRIGPVARPWRLMRPRVLLAAVRLAGGVTVRIVRANVSLARRIWKPSLPLRSGMIVLPTRQRGDAGLAGVGLVTSLIVDNQIVDLDRSEHVLQYHAVEVPEGDEQTRVEAVNGPVERWIDRLERG